MDRSQAHSVLERCRIPAEFSGAPNFFKLSVDQVDLLVTEADRVKYRKPTGAHGSRARAFYKAVTRALERED